jgi:hypothetical protein
MSDADILAALKRWAAEPWFCDTKAFLLDTIALIERLSAENARLTPTWSSDKPSAAGDYLIQRADSPLFAWTFTKGDFGKGMAADGFVARGCKFAGPIVVHEPAVRDGDPMDVAGTLMKEGR